MGCFLIPYKYYSKRRFLGQPFCCCKKATKKPRFKGLLALLVLGNVIVLSYAVVSIIQTITHVLCHVADASSITTPNLTT